MAIRLNIIQLRLYISLSLHVLLPTVLCVFSLSRSFNYSAKPCLKTNKKKLPPPMRSSNLFVVFKISFFFDIPLSSLIYITYTHTHINMLDYHLLFFISLLFVCVSLLSKRKKNDRTAISIRFFFSFSLSTDVILWMIRNID